mmetsp:Transcript_7091/g.26561  ORF Transcript_7091/g.26561 Transcript_7091/m.26561 type:complete len:87 (+) Transcript_7091:1378-1638(+)
MGLEALLVPCEDDAVLEEEFTTISELGVRLLLLDDFGGIFIEGEQCALCHQGYAILNSGQEVQEVKRKMTGFFFDKLNDANNVKVS